ncbi:MAG TPA: trypsin-like peptidase domain-containing protein [Ktedonobacterales bacterium]|nr:trypsin-like peptidase domain-containing protein [Ktedonobacterales bacterium]
MQDNSRDPRASNVPTSPVSTNMPVNDAIPPTTPPVAPQATPTTPTTPQVTPPTTAPSAPAQYAQRTAHGRSWRPLWIALGAAVLFGLIFGAGTLAGRTNGTSTSSAPSGTDIETATINVIHNVDPSVVQIQGRGGLTGGSVGSGEILTSDGYIVTNSHVVHGLSTYTVLLANGQQIPATLIGEAPSEDLAVLKVNATDLKPIAVGDSSKVVVGEFALAVGSPLGLEQSATSGIISALNRQAAEVVDGRRFIITGLIQTSAPINPGNSGGALVNFKGQLIGIPTLAAVEPSTGVAANGIGFAISSNRMKTIVNQLTGGALF